jgi:hypothetical protein
MNHQEHQVLSEEEEEEVKVQELVVMGPVQEVWRQVKAERDRSEGDRYTSDLAKG